MTVETRDILLKAAEDVQSGMWCKGAYFAEHELVHPNDFLRNHGNRQAFDKALSSHRCALGSLAVATALLGGNGDDWDEAGRVVQNTLRAEQDGNSSIVYYNDRVLPDDPFAAGQQLAELFRQTAETL